MPVSRFGFWYVNRMLKRRRRKKDRHAEEQAEAAVDAAVKARTVGVDHGENAASYLGDDERKRE